VLIVPVVLFNVVVVVLFDKFIVQEKEDDQRFKEKESENEKKRIVDYSDTLVKTLVPLKILKTS
jgi:Na+/H+ antiporter NhaD/arsenite permease-like protein